LLLKIATPTSGGILAPFIDRPKVLRPGELEAVLDAYVAQ
jgi:hypothetical protein